MEREYYLEQINKIFKIHPICALWGPRQVGKTTLAKRYCATMEDIAFYDLENPLDIARLENPMLALSVKHSLIVIDEIQKRPDLFPVLRVLVDQNQQKFLILGSASRELLRQSSESLAGRIGYRELPPFSLDETQDFSKLWLRGGFPKSYLASHDEMSLLWRKSYITTFLEKDIPNLGIHIPPMQIRRFWLMLAHYHGQIFNASEIGRSLGISDHTVRRYLDILIGTFMIRPLTPWFENLSKRQVKSPKIYFRDSGVLHALLDIQNMDQLQHYPRLGSFWEGFALEETIRFFGKANEENFFWATQSGAELDLFFHHEGKRIGFEFKYTDSPKITSSMKIAWNDLKLDHLYLIFPGKEHFQLTENILALGLESPHFNKEFKREASR